MNHAWSPQPRCHAPPPPPPLQFARPEDGSWDPDYPDTFYFQTTANITGVTKLWRCKFDDVEEPTKGGYCRIVVNGKPGSNGKPDESAPVMLDNLVVHDGVCYLQVGGTGGVQGRGVGSLRGGAGREMCVEVLVLGFLRDVCLGKEGQQRLHICVGTRVCTVSSIMHTTTVMPCTMSQPSPH